MAFELCQRRGALFLKNTTPQWLCTTLETQSPLPQPFKVICMGEWHRRLPQLPLRDPRGVHVLQPFPSGEARPSTALPDLAPSSGQDATIPTPLDNMLRSYSLSRARGNLPHAAASSNAASRSGAMARDESPPLPLHPWCESSADDASFNSSVSDSEPWQNPNGSESDGVSFQPPSALLEEAICNIRHRTLAMI